MMKMITDADFTEETKKDFDSLVNDKISAFDMLVENYQRQGMTDYDYDKIVTRLQTQYFALTRDENRIKSYKAWDQNESYEPNEVNREIPQVTKGKYYAFALKKTFDWFEIEYPLTDDYVHPIFRTFYNKNIPDVTFKTEIETLKRKFGIKYRESDFYDKSFYKRKKSALAVMKVKNAFLHLAKKPLNFKGIHKGKIQLRAKFLNYKASNIEKLARVYDDIFKGTIEKLALEYKHQYKIKLAPELLFAARVYADVMYSRIFELKNVNNNKILERCFWLQFASILNKYCFDANQLSLITELGTRTAVDMCKEMGITKGKIIQKMTKLGFSYNSVPEDEFEAILLAKQNDYSIYTQESFEKSHANKFEYANAKQNDEKFDVRIAATDASETSEKNVVEEKVLEKETKDTTEGQQTAIKPFTDIDERVKRVVKASTVEKMVDKIVVKFLATQGTNLAEKLNTDKVKGKKRQVVEKQLNLYNLMLSYYVQATHSKPMAVKNDGTYNENEISKAKIITKGLILKRAELANLVTNSELERQENQKSSTFINAVCKSHTNYTVKELFTKLIKGCVNVITTPSQEQTTYDADKFFDQLVDEKYKEVEKSENYVPDFVIVDEGKDPVVSGKPNFIIVDEGKPPVSERPQKVKKNADENIK